ncbi:alpha/beta fold hydrolase [Atopococcus tabaci]|uniref:alpha/beta fold hydrolase n=1 Tax=Atopococcus tabaci TaxID=269774 RepID=UPI0004245197|nr:alpha/beta hydrolase [Atopococcus tabaci]
MIDYEEITSSGKETILFIHRLGTSRWIWWQQIPAFKDYRLLLVDLPGHGKSVSTPWTNLKETVDLIAQHVIQNRAVYVVGLSLGGHVALELVKQYPEKIQSAFISGITVEPLPFRFFLRAQSWVIHRGQQNPQYLTKLARDAYQLPEEKIPDFITNYQLLTRQSYETIFKEIMDFRLDESYGSIVTPCFIVAGEEESRNRLKSVEVGPRYIPGAGGKVIPGAGHTWSVGKADQFNQELRDWLTQTNNPL